MQTNTRMRIWHVANFPREAFKSIVNSTEQAKAILNALAEYDLFIGEDGKNTITLKVKDIKNKFVTETINSIPR